MNYLDDFQVVERRRRILRVVLFVVILGTLPFYCAGFLLLGTAPRDRTREDTVASLTPIQNVRASNTPFPTLGSFVTATQLSPLRPTPLQFNPGTRPIVPVFPTNTPFIYVPPPTSVIIPTNTPAPTLTPFPTQVPPTAVPTETWTPLPTEPPLPTNTTEPPTAEPPTDDPAATEAA
jgi:hypothetical protein